MMTCQHRTISVVTVHVHPLQRWFTRTSDQEHTVNILPEQEVTETTGSDSLKGVHLELVGVVVRFLRANI